MLDLKLVRQAAQVQAWSHRPSPPQFQAQLRRRQAQLRLQPSRRQHPLRQLRLLLSQRQQLLLRLQLSQRQRRRLQQQNLRLRSLRRQPSPLR